MTRTIPDQEYIRRLATRPTSLLTEVYAGALAAGALYLAMSEDGDGAADPITIIVFLLMILNVMVLGERRRRIDPLMREVARLREELRELSDHPGEAA